MENKEFLEDKIKKVTSSEVKKLFKDEFGVYLDSYSEYAVECRDYENDNYKVQSEVDSYGGEGQGEEYWTISRILDKRTEEVFFIKFDGYYDSWEGSDFSNNDWNIVEPKVVKVIQWC
jgi:hypothetical protein